jgi:hypothetical protein
VGYKIESELRARLSSIQILNPPFFLPGVFNHTSWRRLNHRPVGKLKSSLLNRMPLSSQVM